MGSSNYCYAFQGQEKDPETGMEAFELRLWDGRLGRWLTVDPYHEFHSPYVGMGNNPISLTDPDGGSTEGGGNCDGCPPGWILMPEYVNRVYGPQEKTFYGGILKEVHVAAYLDPIDLRTKPISIPKTPPAPSPPTVAPTNPGITGLALIWALFYTPDDSPFSPTNYEKYLNPEGLQKKKDEYATIRVQLQQGRHNHLADAVANNTASEGVTVLQTEVALAKMTGEAAKANKKLVLSTPAQNALKKLKAKILRARESGGLVPGPYQTDIQQLFEYNGMEYRFDVENVRGHNLRK